MYNHTMYNLYPRHSGADAYANLTQMTVGGIEQHFAYAENPAKNSGQQTWSLMNNGHLQVVKQQRPTTDGAMEQYTLFSCDGTTNSTPDSGYGSPEHNQQYFEVVPSSQQIVFEVIGPSTVSNKNAVTYFASTEQEVMQTNPNSDVNFVTGMQVLCNAHAYMTENYYQHDESQQTQISTAPMQPNVQQQLDQQQSVVSPQFGYSQQAISTASFQEMNSDGYQNQIQEQEVLQSSVPLSNPTPPSSSTGENSVLSRRSAKPSVIDFSDFYCDICEKYYARKLGLTQHIQSIHTERNYRCTRCGKRFVSEGKLMKHIDQHDRIDKPFKCQYCSKTYNNKIDLRRHSFVHNEADKPYKCELCSKRFSRSDRFTRHRKNHERMEAKRMQALVVACM